MVSCAGIHLQRNQVWKGKSTALRIYKKKERKAQGLTFLRVLARAKPDCATTESVTLYCFGLFYPNSVHLNTLAEIHLSGDLVTKLTVLYFFCNFAPLNQ